MKSKIPTMRNGIKKLITFYQPDISKCRACGKEGRHSTVMGYKICNECMNKYAHQTIY